MPIDAQGDTSSAMVCTIRDQATTRLAFETDVQTNTRRNIATIRPDSSGFRALTHGGVNLDPAWSR